MNQEYSFGRWMRKRRETLGLTQVALAQAAGYSAAMIRKIENDERRPSEEGAALLAEALEIRPEQRDGFLRVVRQERAVDFLGAVDDVEPFPWQMATRPRSNLPLPATLFVGREEELARFGELVADPSCRLVTLVGLAGIGKSRLALEMAHSQLERFAHGAFFVALGSLDAPELMVTAIAQATGVQLHGPAEPQEQLLRFLQRKEMLLVLDNFEHLMGGASLLSEILQQARDVQLLVTSRERLNLRGEWVFDVEGLAYPEYAGEARVAEVAPYPAVQLFAQAAVRANPGFSLSEENVAWVVRVCRLTEGVPLGLELAAAWVRVLSCRAIAEEIERNLDFLKAPAQDMPERHRSLRAALDHSWKLLPAEEKAAFCQLSIFRGGFDRESAQTVAGAGLEVLTSLLDKSLLRRVGEKHGEIRYDLHELVRQYAMEHLQEDVQLWTATRERYAAFFLALAEAAEVALKGAEQLQWLERLEQEHDNVRALLKASPGRGSVTGEDGITAALKLAASLSLFWHMRGYFSEGRGWLTKLLQRYPEEGTAVRARALEGLALLAHGLGEHEAAVEAAGEAIAIYRNGDNRQGLARALTLKGVAVRWRGSATQARASLEEALAIHREVGDRWGIAANLFELGRHLAYFEGDVKGQAMLEESAAILDDLGDSHTYSAVLTSLGIITMGCADYAAARDYLERSLAIAREIGDPWHAAEAVANLGELDRLQGAFASSRARVEEALQVFQEGGSRAWEIDPLCALAENDILQGNLADARAQLGEVRSRPEISANKRLQVLATYLEGILAYYEGDEGRAVALLEETVALAAASGYKLELARGRVALGRAMPASAEGGAAGKVLREGLQLYVQVGNRLGIVTALEGLAGPATDDAARAASLLATATAAREAMGAPLPPVEQPERERVLTAIRTGLGEETFEQAWAEGQAMSPEQAAASLLAES